MVKRSREVLRRASGPRTQRQRHSIHLSLTTDSLIHFIHEYSSITIIHTRRYDHGGRFF